MTGRGGRSGGSSGNEVRHQTTLGRRMIERARQAAVPFQWVTGDDVYGNDGEMRRWLEGQKIFYVLAVSSQYRVFYKGSRRWAAEIAKLLSQREWRRLSAGAGTKGERLYDWALLPLGEVDED